MKLYGEVKGSDRHSDGDVLMTIQSFGEVIYSGRGREIEIKEEEIRGQHPIDKRPGQVYENAYNDGWNDAITELLSKLKPE